MNAQLKSLIEDYKKTDWNFLLREDLGEHHLKEIKPHLDFIKNLIDDVVNSSHLESLLQSPRYYNLIQNLLQHFQNMRNGIIGNKDTGRNQQMVNNVLWLKTYIVENFQSLFFALKLLEEYRPGKTSDKSVPGFKQYFSSQKEWDVAVKKYISEAKKEMDQEFKKVRQVQSQLSEQTIRAEVERYGDFFKREWKNNKKLSWFFGIGLAIFSIIACWFAYYFLKFDQNIIANSSFELIIKGDIINKVFIFSIIVFIITLLKREYLALRHQFTVNKHRHNALSSHKEILNSIKKTENNSDKEISNAVLLELTKSMFSPQDTGFVKDQKNSSSDNKVVEISKSLFTTSTE